ncbi:DUF6477 family protein [Oceanicella actignis]|uniref:Uncharacterized protein n=1 Tax=Oceanicella actignis TaxID=1189325 RepID=A0A1M7TX94_9RHOB|nr:DUF6477 family protein [Oceanicella actignis]TYO89598.1 hypothetical protein LY05_01587 [Oceanicella actignis]SET80057.1 hypothetical protein SAMN04488119_11028 [Oceanicella actignis]SHN75338.1 hypothetical protein SAMN05216200_11128 [Oceanicella actignis]
MSFAYFPAQAFATAAPAIPPKGAEPAPTPRIPPAHALRGLRRPRILARAARAAAAGYARKRDLPRLLPGFSPRDPSELMGKLRQVEAECEKARRAKATGYCAVRHVGILAALIAEAAAPTRTLRA